MPNSKHVQDFLQAVCIHLKYGSLHEDIKKELADHIEDQKNEYLKRGFDEDTAILKAVEEMGDPEVVGRRLDKAHRPRTEWSILLLLSVLVISGGVMQYFLAGVSERSMHMFSSFLLYAPVGVIAFVITYYFNYTLLARYAKILGKLIPLMLLPWFVIVNHAYSATSYSYYFVLLFVPLLAVAIIGFREKKYVGIVLSGLFCRSRSPDCACSLPL